MSIILFFAKTVLNEKKKRFFVVFDCFYSFTASVSVFTMFSLTGSLHDVSCRSLLSLVRRFSAPHFLPSFSTSSLLPLSLLLFFCPGLDCCPGPPPDSQCSTGTGWSAGCNAAGHCIYSYAPLVVPICNDILGCDFIKSYEPPPCTTADGLAGLCDTSGTCGKCHRRRFLKLLVFIFFVYLSLVSSVEKCPRITCPTPDIQCGQGICDPKSGQCMWPDNMNRGFRGTGFCFTLVGILGSCDATDGQCSKY